MLPAAYFRDSHLLVSLGDGRGLSCHDVSSNDLIMSEGMVYLCMPPPWELHFAIGLS